MRRQTYFDAYNKAVMLQEKAGQVMGNPDNSEGVKRSAGRAFVKFARQAEKFLDKWIDTEGEVEHWMIRHSVNCYYCGDLFDGRVSVGSSPTDGGEVCHQCSDKRAVDILERYRATRLLAGIEDTSTGVLKQVVIIEEMLELIADLEPSHVAQILVDLEVQQFWLPTALKIQRLRGE